MLRYALRLATIFILVQALTLVPLAKPHTEEKPTPLEIRQALEISYLFTKRLEETGDLSRVIDELYVEDFIWRYVQEQKHELADSNFSSDVMFVPGLSYKAGLLMQATEQDWRQFYVATHNFYYYVMTIGLNLYANDLLNEKEPDEDAMNKLLPASVSALFDKHPILKNFFEAKGDAKAIETPEEMRSVSEALGHGLQLLLDDQPNRSVKLNQDANQVLEKLRQAEFAAPMLEITERDSFGYLAGTRMLLAITPMFFGLRLVEVNGTQKIVWAEMVPGD